jgi:hypothetical protein
MIHKSNMPMIHLVELLAKRSPDQSRPLASTPTQIVVATIARKMSTTMAERFARQTHLPPDPAASFMSTARRSRLIDPAASCRVGRLRSAYSTTVARGRVVLQKPKPGILLPKLGLKKIDLVVSRGRKR